jgi:hypothetical protein
MPLQHLVSFCLNLVSRAFEFQVSKCASTATSYIVSQTVFCCSLSSFTFLVHLPPTFKMSWCQALKVVLGVQADAFARKLGYAVPLRAGLIKLQVCCNSICNFSQLLQQFTIFALEIVGNIQRALAVPLLHKPEHHLTQKLSNVLVGAGGESISYEYRPMVLSISLLTSTTGRAIASPGHGHQEVWVTWNGSPRKGRYVENALHKVFVHCD